MARGKSDPIMISWRFCIEWPEIYKIYIYINIQKNIKSLYILTVFGLTQNLNPSWTGNTTIFSEDWETL